MKNPHKTTSPRLIAWEITRNCNLSCQHCRAAAMNEDYSGELHTQKCFDFLDQVAEMGQPIIILTGGEPLLRDDIFDIAEYGTQKGLRMVMAPNGTLVNHENALKLKNAGIQRISVSLDGHDATSHDQFRGVDGAFERALEGIQHAKDVGLPFQINTTVTQQNLGTIEKIQELAIQLDAVAHHIFLLVPTGRGKYIANQSISATEYENTLNWFYEQRDKTRIELKATCAPHYYRILRQNAKNEGKTVSFQTHGLDAVTRGCLGGTHFCFISHRGIVQPCGFLDLNCGDITSQSFHEIWQDSPIFNSLRDYDQLKGKCGVCEYRKFCGGCRARAYEATGDYLAEEPLCSFQPGTY